MYTQVVQRLSDSGHPPPPSLFPLTLTLEAGGARPEIGRAAPPPSDVDSAVVNLSVLEERGNNVLPFKIHWGFGCAVSMAVVALLACIQHPQGCTQKDARRGVDHGKKGCEDAWKEEGKLGRRLDIRVDFYFDRVGESRIAPILGTPFLRGCRRRGSRRLQHCA